jgi:hypothetical protein
MEKPIEVEELIEEFDYQTYARCSDNNMPMLATFVPLSEEEQAETEEALQLG